MYIIVSIVNENTITMYKWIKTFVDGTLQEHEPSVEEMYGKLQDPCSEAKLLLDQANDESHKIGKAGMDLHSALQRVRFHLWFHTAAWNICKVIKIEPQTIILNNVNHQNILAD